MPSIMAWPSRLARVAAARALAAFLFALLSSGCGDPRDPVAPTPNEPDEPAGATADPRIAFTSTRDGSSAIYVANEDGSGVRRLTRGETPA